MIEEILYVFEVVLGAFLCLQWGSILLFFLLEWAIVDYYEWGTFERPKSIIDKIQNVCMMLVFGSGYFWYRKFRQRVWIIRKLYMLIALILHGILSIIIFYIVTLPLDFIVSLFS
ncbi:hypothetical protein [Bacillus sp. FJAT-47783]|uniref:hypothetical protein n=1 Tax=Bacillus sp. FJAT-47783 TaxID=2922712 RepID=UPI001FAD0AE4|nr:hypothetical protein [Bacillus sp. FJAT-47783]